jgi:hypothetical protein
MIDKGIGFNRTLKRAWLDAAAAFCAALAGTDDLQQALRARLEDVLASDVHGDEARRKTIDLLINLWLRTREVAPALWETAVAWNQTTTAPEDRVWLHYGLSLVYYDFFARCVTAIGQFSRYEEAVTTRMVLRQLTAEMGQLGSLSRATRHLIASLRDWGVLTSSEKTRYAYVPQRGGFRASDVALEAWLLACALRAHPAEELPFADLLRLPMVFPFHFTLRADHLRAHPWFTVQRQGAGWDMIRLFAK